MASFAYRAARPDGALVDGRIEADSRDLALHELRARGLVALRLDGPAAAQPAPGASADPPQTRLGRLPPWTARGPGPREVLAFTGELAAMLRAGLPLDRSLRVLADMDRTASMRAVLADLLASVKAGRSLSQALAAHPALFGEFYLGMVRAGEAGGRLAEVLARLAEHLERSRALREAVLSAVLYPAILTVVALASVILMLAFVIPRFEALFGQMGEALPLSARITVAAGHFVLDWGGPVALALATASALAYRALRSPRGRAWGDAQLLRLPVLGALARKTASARFARSLGTLLSSGVPVVTAVRIASDSVGSAALRPAVAGMATALKQGGRMSEALAGTGVFAPFALNMVRLGEETGRLDQMLLELARMQDDELQVGIGRALTLLEPALILGLGGIIGLIIASVLAGILSINELAG